MKKGRHRRFEEARALKRTNDLDIDAILDQRDAEPCPECGAVPVTITRRGACVRRTTTTRLWPA